MNLSCRSIGGLVKRVLTVGCFCFLVSFDSLNFICFEGGENISSEANNDKSKSSLSFESDINPESRLIEANFRSSSVSVSFLNILEYESSSGRREDKLGKQEMVENVPSATSRNFTVGHS